MNTVLLFSFLFCFCRVCHVFFFFFNDTATTEIYTLSLHDALPIWASPGRVLAVPEAGEAGYTPGVGAGLDRKSTRLNSSHGYISYAVFCLKKKKIHKTYSDYNAAHCSHILVHYKSRLV